jgi:uncharacterized phage protein (TIGR02218 family)
MTALWLAKPLVTAAWCWRLERRDGMVLGLTSHDRDLMLAGLLYRAAPGMRPSSIEQNDRIEAHSIDLTGAISSAAIRAEDIAAGRWDCARLTLLIANWEAPGGDALVVATGELGNIVQRGGGFSAELSGPLAGLDQQRVPVTTPTCRAALGDRQCRVALAPLTRVVRVTAISGRSVTVGAALASGAFVLGRLRWLDGALAGVETAIMAQDGVQLVLADMPVLAPPLPARVRLRAGCDKRLETCAGRFDNAINFRGEAHLPGFDLLTRYPGG